MKGRAQGKGIQRAFSAAFIILMRTIKDMKMTALASNPKVSECVQHTARQLIKAQPKPHRESIQNHAYPRAIASSDHPSIS
ncbi:MAG: hypothetical protein V6Z82_03030 [Flavobacteriales bacterium]